MCKFNKTVDYTIKVCDNYINLKLKIWSVFFLYKQKLFFFLKTALYVLNKEVPASYICQFSLTLNNILGKKFSRQHYEILNRK